MNAPQRQLRGPDDPFALGELMINPAALELSREGRTIRVKPMVMRILTVLAETCGAPVRRDDLVELVWGGAFVTDDAVNQGVSRLRRALEDVGASPAVHVETLPKVGYRLRADVSAPNVPAARPTRSTLRPALLAGAAGVTLAAALAFGARITPTDRTVGHWLDAPTRASMLTSLPGREVTPALSPDGRRLAFAWRDPEGDTGYDLYLTSITASEPRRLVGDVGQQFAPAWSPDGDRMAYVDQNGHEACAIRVIPIMGGPTTKIADCNAPSVLAVHWSPDGTTLAILAQNELGGPSRLRLLDLATGAVRPSPQPAQLWIEDGAFAFSPDGASIALVRNHGRAGGDVWLWNLESGAMRQVTAELQWLPGLAWSANGRRIIVSSTRSGLPSLWSIDTVTRAFHPIQAPGQYPLGVSAAMTDDSIAYVVLQGHTNLIRLDRGANWRTEVTAASSAYEWDVDVSPDGGRLAFVSERTGRPQVWTSEIDGTQLRRLTDFKGGGLVADVRWSPDGRRLAFVASENGRIDVFVANVETARLTRITEHPAPEEEPRWSPDGKALLFASKRTGDWRIFKAHLGAEIRVDDEPTFDAPAYSVEFGPEGRPFLLHKDWSLRRVGVDGGLEPFAPDTKLTDSGGWRITQDAIYAVIATTNGKRLARLDLESEAMTPLLDDLQAPRESGLAVNPMTGDVYYTRQERAEIDIARLFPGDAPE